MFEYVLSTVFQVLYYYCKSKCAWLVIGKRRHLHNPSTVLYSVFVSTSVLLVKLFTRIANLCKVSLNKTFLTLLSSLIILLATTDECFKFCAIFIISSAMFSCMLWWYFSTVSILSSFVSPFLSPVSLQWKHDYSMNKLKRLTHNKFSDLNSLNKVKKKQGYLFRKPWESFVLSKIKKVQ